MGAIKMYLGCANPNTGTDTGNKMHAISQQNNLNLSFRKLNFFNFTRTN